MSFMTAMRALIYPPQCAICEELILGDGGLCAACWGKTRFLTGLCCDICAMPLPGESVRPELCDACLAAPPPWARGRAVFAYEGNGGRIVRAFKNGDRLDLAPILAAWLLRAGADLMEDDPLLVPVPSHWTRLASRRFNQSATLAAGIARARGRRGAGPGFAPRALLRPVRAARQRDASFAQRAVRLKDAFIPHPRHGGVMRGRRVVLVDDVLTSGSTLRAASAACLEGGAGELCVLLLARVTGET
ncbi:ComF family protein [Profundibacterium mesophilum]|uniref:Competence protein F n=1 Tax=Profundibacterium mesophilum KAUST100406-0324 TaxID=1037889 RepID=A0A921TDH3_9RHOB|nr:ComF family protein [Profundibacterium mesophilum]KAF0676351.1 Competence protein F [Profundibacterium mesophilum KAUST100406-0324]